MSTDQPLSTEAPLVDAVRAIESTRRRLAVVADTQGRLAGTLTDGDVRRCLLAGGTLQTPVSQAMNRHPVTAPEGGPAQHVLELMRQHNLAAIPIVDAAGHCVRVTHLSDLEPEQARADAADFAFAVIMAGGEGLRLRPVTEHIPKPMVEIGGVPVLERQIHRLVRAGVRLAYLSVNYLSHVIEDHFGDGARFGLDIRYLREREKLGTGGALSLLPERPVKPIVVMNGDIVTTSDFGSLHAYHEAHQADVTVAAVDYRIDIPFGVLHAQGPLVTALSEKPSQRFLCNAGIYAVSPAALALVPTQCKFNMTDLLDLCLQQRRRVAVFPMHEYWSDIGTPDDLERARRLFADSQPDAGPAELPWPPAPPEGSAAWGHLR